MIDPLFMMILAAGVVCIALIAIACAVALDERRYYQRRIRRIDEFKTKLEHEKARTE